MVIMKSTPVTSAIFLVVFISDSFLLVRSTTGDYQPRRGGFAHARRASRSGHQPPPPRRWNTATSSPDIAEAPLDRQEGRMCPHITLSPRARR
jgi:hypothetical protein